MNKIILSLAAAAALAGAGGAFAQSRYCPGGLPDATGACIRQNGNVPAVRQSEDQTLLGLTFDGNRYSYREPDRGPYAYYGNDRRRDDRWDNNGRRRGDRDRDGIRDNRDYDRDGDGVRNSRDRFPSNKNRH